MSNVKWVSDPLHSELNFRIKHLMISHVTGAISSFKVTADVPDQDFSKASITLTADVTTITTYNEQRDQHLRSKDFFETETYPKLTFRSTRIEKTDADSFEVYGELTLKGISKPVKLTAEFSGILDEPGYGKKVGVSVNGKINRSDWGISFNRVLESGGVGLGEEIKIQSELQLTPQPL